MSALAIFAGACSSLPKPASTVTGKPGSALGQWRGNALLKNTKTKKNGTLELEMIAQEPDRLRVEALGPFGVHVASVATKENDVMISLTREKKFVYARADRTALARLIPVRVAPSDLLNILFDRPLDEAGGGWKCDRTKPAPEWACESGKAKIERKPDENKRRKFLFTAPDAEMTLILTESPLNTELGESVYTLAPTPGYAIEDRR